MERLTEFVNKSFEGSKEATSKSADREIVFVRHPEPGTSFNDDDDDDDDGVDDESVDVCNIKEEDVTVDDDDDAGDVEQSRFISAETGNDNVKSAGKCVCVCVCVVGVRVWLVYVVCV